MHRLNRWVKRFARFSTSIATRHIQHRHCDRCGETTLWYLYAWRGVYQCLECEQKRRSKSADDKAHRTKRFVAR